MKYMLVDREDNIVDRVELTSDVSSTLSTILSSRSTNTYFIKFPYSLSTICIFNESR